MMGLPDKNNILNEVNRKLDETEEQLRNEANTMSTQERRQAEEMRKGLIQLERMVPDIQDMGELKDLLTRRNLGVLETRFQKVIRANDNDLAQIRLATGKNLKDTSKWESSWLKAQEVYKKRYQEAKANNFGEKKEDQQKETPTENTSTYSTGGAY